MVHLLDDYRTVDNKRVDVVYNTDTRVYFAVLYMNDDKPSEIPFSDLSDLRKFVFSFIHSYNTMFMGFS